MMQNGFRSILDHGFVYESYKSEAGVDGELIGIAGWD